MNQAWPDVTVLKRSDVRMPNVPCPRGTNKPCRTVSGDDYDVVVRPDGIYFIMADVSGKGITAALVMASVATSFNIFTRTDPTPAEPLRWRQRPRRRSS